MMAKTKPRRRVKGLKLRGEVWWWRGKVRGTRYWRSTECRDFESAQRRAIDIQRELRDVGFGWRQNVPTWDEWLKTYQKTHEAQKAGTTQRRDKATFEHAKAAFSGKPLNAIKQSDCLAYLTIRRSSFTSNPGRKTQTPIREGTVQRERRLLQAVMEAAVREGIIPTNPWRGIRWVPDIARHRILLPEDEQKLLTILSPRFQRFVTFLLQTGLRLDECRGIDPKQHIRGAFVRVRRKGGKHQDVPLTPTAAATLGDQLKADKELWTQNPQRLREVLALAARRAHIPHLSPHDLRHTFGHRWLQRGGDIYSLSLILGDTVAVVERHYAYLLKEDLAAKMHSVMGTQQ